MAAVCSSKHDPERIAVKQNESTARGLAREVKQPSDVMAGHARQCCMVRYAGVQKALSHAGSDMDATRRQGHRLCRAESSRRRK